ncbi:hypothetical protein I4U23_001103 [Adineta vaga]|nr:hypothetical protein I4U23_001103 [Adineta vaga]
MYISRILSVGLMIIISLCLFTVYYPQEITSPLFDYGLLSIIKCLTTFQIYLRQLIIQPTQLIIDKEEHIKRIDGSVNYHLSQYEQECPHHRYHTRIITRKPLIIYIEQFLTRNEIEHLSELAEPLFHPSKVYDVNGAHNYDTYRTSSSANLKRHQTSVVKCIEQRFAQFQGNIEVERIEPFQIVKYTPDQQFQPHYDWFWQADLLKNGGQRLTTFVTYLQANCSKGETEFIEVRFNETLHEQLCDILFCDEKSTGSGIRFRPIPGNSIFWSNVDKEGRLDYLTYHAGRPPGENGYKMGLNAWTRARPFSVSSEE